MNFRQFVLGEEKEYIQGSHVISGVVKKANGFIAEHTLPLPLYSGATAEDALVFLFGMYTQELDQLKYTHSCGDKDITATGISIVDFERNVIDLWIHYKGHTVMARMYVDMDHKQLHLKKSDSNYIRPADGFSLYPDAVGDIQTVLSAMLETPLIHRSLFTDVRELFEDIQYLADDIRQEAGNGKKARIDISR